MDESSAPREEVEASAVLDEMRSSHHEVGEQPTVVNPIFSPEIPIPEVENPVAEVAQPESSSEELRDFNPYNYSSAD